MRVSSFSGSGASFWSLGALLSLTSLVAAAPHAEHHHSSTLVTRQDSTLDDCLTAANIEYSISSSATWTSDIEAWNSRISPVPSAVVFPKSEDEVVAALACAKSAGIKVTTLGGNRSFSSMGFGRNDGAMIVNLKNMKILTYDESTGLLTYGGPVMISEAANLMYNDYNRTLPHGRCPDVGMPGVAASGFGTLSRANGTVLDNLVGCRVALANGSIVDADATTNTDLYFGVRGAASSMGVVLQYHLKTLDIPSMRVVNYTIAFNSSYEPTQQDNVNALLGTQAWATSDENTDLLSIRYSLSTSSSLKGFFYGNTEQFQPVGESLLRNLPAGMVLTTTENDFWTSEDISTPGIIAETITGRRYFYIASVTLPTDGPLDNSTAWSLYSSTAYAPTLTDASASGFVDIWGGAYTATVDTETSAWRHENNLHLVRWDIRSSSFDVAFAESTLTQMRAKFYEFVDAYKEAGNTPGGFTTYRDDRWTIEETAEYLYRDNFERLQEVKTEYDPEELFNTDPQAIPALNA